MATVHLSVPHLTRTLQRGERVVLQDVLRVERAGDDLLAWVRQVDGSIQLQRLGQFFALGMDAVLVSQPVGGQPEKAEIFTASSDVSSTVFASEAVSQQGEIFPGAWQDFEGDVLWLQLLVDDLASSDEAWRLLADQLQSAQSTLGNIYIQVDRGFGPILMGDVRDVTMDRPSYFSWPVIPAPVPRKPVPSVTHLQVLGADDTGVADDGVTSNTKPTISGKTEAGAWVRLVEDVDGDGAISAAEAVNFLKKESCLVLL